MIYKNKNIIFIILLGFLILSIALLNYFVDPYNVIHKTSKPFKMYEYPLDMYAAAIKLSKDVQYDYIVMGGSGARVLYDIHLLGSSKVIYAETIHFEILRELPYLNFILKVHPEIKTIVFPVEYLFYYDIDYTVPEISDNTILTLNDIIRLFLNIETTKESIKKLKKLMQNKYNNFALDVDVDLKENITDEFRIKQISGYSCYRRNYRERFYFNNHDDSLLRSFIVKKYEYLKEIKNIIGDRKIIFIIPPYHSIMQGVLYLDDNYNSIEKVKKLLVDNYPDAEIYDFSYINKYTTANIETHTLYLDVAHPNGYYGTFFYCALKYSEEFKNKDVYVKLNKDNIEKTLEWQRKRLEDYSTKNSIYIRNFMSTDKIENEKYLSKTTYNLPKNCQWYIENY